MRKLFLLSLSTLMCSALFAQIKSVEFLPAKGEQYKRMDFSVKLTSDWKNPYLQEEVTLDLHIQTPSGQTLVQPCFYVSGSSGQLSDWSARFAPKESGMYKFHFVLLDRGKVSSKSEVLQATVDRSADQGFLKVKNNWVLEFDNGEPFRGIAENICWESRTHDDSKYFASLHERADVYNYDYLLPDFAQNGGNFFRTWMCSWNLPIDYQSGFNNARYKESPAYYNESAVERMDHLINLADSLDLYIMLTLGTGNFRGRDPEVVKTTDDFFASPVAKATYKNRLRYIVARWGYSPHIAMWEFMNEVDNIQLNGREDRPIKPQDIVDWHREMSAYLKAIDPYQHIMTTSISHRDIAGLNDIATIDINQKHIYNHTDILADEINKYTEAHGKPYIIGEFGYEWDWQKNFDDFTCGMETDFKRGLWYGLFSPTPVLPMSWWWEYFENRGMTAYFQGVRSISDQMLQAGKGDFQPLKVTAEDLHVYAVQCGEVVYVYVFNPTNRVAKQNLSVALDRKGTFNVTAFEPTQQKYTESGPIRNENGIIVLEDVFIGSKKELVYIVK